MPTSKSRLRRNIAPGRRHDTRGAKWDRRATARSEAKTGAMNGVFIEAERDGMPGGSRTGRFVCRRRTPGRTNHHILRHLATCPICRDDVATRRAWRTAVRQVFDGALEL